MGEGGDGTGGFDAVAAAILGGVEGAVAGFEQGEGWFVCVGCGCGYADADGLEAAGVAGVVEAEVPDGLATVSAMTRADSRSRCWGG